jgi:hypothetical protein
LAVRSTTDRFLDKHFSLCTFDAIGLADNSDLPAGGLGVFSNAAFAHHAEQLTYLNCWIFNFQGTQEE